MRIAVAILGLLACALPGSARAADKPGVKVVNGATRIIDFVRAHVNVTRSQQQ
jgi:hypothetical protein